MSFKLYILFIYILFIYFTGKIEAVFRVCREGEEEKLYDCRLDNHRLLFHGTNTSNLLSILTRGLLVSPQEAAITGRSLGNVRFI